MSGLPSEPALPPRVEPASLADLRWRERVVVRVIGRAVRGEPPHVFTTLAKHHRLFRRWLPFAGWLLLRTELPRQDVELVVLRTAWNCASPYEWAQHVVRAQGLGIDQATIARVAERTATEGVDGAETWSARQRWLLLAVDELHANRVISDRTWKGLLDHLSESQLIELCFVVGHYEMLAMVLNSLGVQPERGVLAGMSAPRAGEVAHLTEMIAGRRAVPPDGADLK
jgi:alkylhydroperoxidase family enzyme